MHERQTATNDLRCSGKAKTTGLCQIHRRGTQVGHSSLPCSTSRRHVVLCAMKTPTLSRNTSVAERQSRRASSGLRRSREDKETDSRPVASEESFGLVVCGANTDSRFARGLLASLGNMLAALEDYSLRSMMPPPPPSSSSLRSSVVGRRSGLTISNNTSPAANASPSFFFQLAIPPSVIVGDMAGMVNFVSSCAMAVVLSAGVRQGVNMGGQLHRSVIGRMKTTRSDATYLAWKRHRRGKP
jgi:hypothetical protein